MLQSFRLNNCVVADVERKDFRDKEGNDVVKYKYVVNHPDVSQSLEFYRDSNNFVVGEIVNIYVRAKAYEKKSYFGFDIVPVYDNQQK